MKIITINDPILGGYWYGHKEITDDLGHATIDKETNDFYKQTTMSNFWLTDFMGIIVNYSFMESDGIRLFNHEWYNEFNK